MAMLAAWLHSQCGNAAPQAGCSKDASLVPHQMMLHQQQQRCRQYCQHQQRPALHVCQTRMMSLSWCGPGALAQLQPGQQQQAPLPARKRSSMQQGAGPSSKRARAGRPAAGATASFTHTEPWQAHSKRRKDVEWNLRFYSALDDVPQEPLSFKQVEAERAGEGFKHKELVHLLHMANQDGVYPRTRVEYLSIISGQPQPSPSDAQLGSRTAEAYRAVQAAGGAVAGRATKRACREEVADKDPT